MLFISRTWHVLHRNLLDFTYAVYNPTVVSTRIKLGDDILTRKCIKTYRLGLHMEKWTINKIHAVHSCQSEYSM